MSDRAWRLDAACRDLSPDIFFPKRGGTGREARAICKTCPVARDCFHFATFQSQEKFGIWSDTNAKQRERIRGGFRKLGATL